MAAERKIHEGEYVSENLGIPYRTETTVIEDACRDCGGDGVIKFSTFADLRQFVIEERAREEDPEPDDEDYFFTPKKSGSRPCERCGGSGNVKGDGGKYVVRMSMSHTIPIKPIG